MQYHGVLFDYDGTLTPRYQNYIPTDLVAQAVQLSRQGIMMGICTARSFASALPKLDPFLQYAGDDPVVQQNWIMICENGSKGYYYDVAKKDYVEFYSAEWPQEIAREALFARLMQEFGNQVAILDNKVSMEIFEKEDLGPDVEQNEISFILRPAGRAALGPKDWEISSGLIHKKVLEILTEFDVNSLLHAGDSKMGVSILPANGDKDRGIKEFANLVAARKGLSIPHPYREIVAIGDQATFGGNDYYFLKGEVGTTFNVGEEEEKTSTSQRIFAENGQPIIGPAATLTILKTLFKKT